MSGDEALERFDRVRVREVCAENEDTASTFQSTAASLEPDERIELEVRDSNIKAVLVDSQASKICSLRWLYQGKEDVTSVVPLLISSCPELASLEVSFEHSFDFVLSVLEHPRNRIVVLEVPMNAKGDLPRFFAALGRSQVSALTLSSDGSLEFYQCLYEYLAKDLLVRLAVSTERRQVPAELMTSLAKCARLVELGMSRCEFSRPIAFPLSITKLELQFCQFGGGFDWSFLMDSDVRELSFTYAKGVDGNQLGSALAVYLRAKGLHKLRLCECTFVDETLAAVGLELGRVKRLDLEESKLNDASVAIIALALQSPNSEIKELVLEYNRSMEKLLVPALKHPNCNLDKLTFVVYHPGQKAAARRMEMVFRRRRALLVLLQGQRVRKQYCPLRRLPVEMFRLVGEVLF